MQVDVGGDFVGDFTLNVLQRALDASVLRQKVIAENIANVDTPFYKRKEVVFEDELKKALDKKEPVLALKVTNPKHIENIETDKLPEPKVKVVDDILFRRDRNNVDIEKELVDLAKNNILYTGLTRLVSTKFSMLKGVIKGR